MTIKLDITLSQKQIEQAIQEYVARELPQHVVDGKLEWVIAPARESWPASVTSVKCMVTPKI